MKSKFFTALALFTVLLLHAAPSLGQNAKDAWKDVIFKCQDNDLIGKKDKVLFFGPSNTLGLGSAWGMTSGGGYSPRQDLNNIFTDSAVRQSMIRPGTNNLCSGIKPTKWSFKFGLPFNIKVPPINGSVGIDISKVKKVTVSADAVYMDQLLDTQFNIALSKLDKSDPNRIDLSKENRYVMTRAFRIKGLKIDIELDKKAAVDVKTALPEGANFTTGKEGASFSVGYDSTGRTLHIQLVGEAIIGGQFEQLTPEGLPLAGGIPDMYKLVEIKLPDNPTFGPRQP